MKPYSKDYPMILGILNSKKNSYQVVGVQKG